MLSAAKRMMEILVLILAFACQHTMGGSDDTGLDSQSTGYLVQFGFMGDHNPNPAMGSLTDPNVMRLALMNFQDFAGLRRTGVMDAETKATMALPRCGVKDIQTMGDDVDAKRKKRYALQGSKWRNKDVTYRITRYSNDMSRAQIDSEIKRAFQVWSDVTDLTFRQKFSGTPDIEVFFATGNHGDGSPFDGAGGTLAHAYFPEFGGDTHIDDAESYTANSRRGVNLFQVTAHEFGHSLGLGHSKVQEALMAPFYRGFQPSFKLHKDDIEGIISVYGRKTPVRPQGTTPTPTAEPTMPTLRTDRPMPTSGKVPTKCDIGVIDVAVNLESNDRAYLFSGDYYWRINTQGVDAGYPKLITRYWGGIPGNLDAGFNLVDGSSVMYFFKGDQFWRFKSGQMQPGYPKRTGYNGKFEGLRGLTLDSAFVWSGNGRIYFTSGGKYYRLARATYNTPLPEDRKIDYGYPRDLYLWRGLPRYGVGAALHYRNGRTYFFNKNNQQYSRFNDRNFAVDTGYPRNTQRWWLGCQSSGLIVTKGPMEQGAGAGLKVVDNLNFDTPLGGDVSGAVTSDTPLGGNVTDTPLGDDVSGAVTSDTPLGDDVSGAVTSDTPLGGNVSGAVTVLMSVFTTTITVFISVIFS